MALKPGKGVPSKDEESEEEAPESGGAPDYKSVMKDAAKDGDWDAFVDALCDYVGK